MKLPLYYLLILTIFIQCINCRYTSRHRRGIRNVFGKITDTITFIRETGNKTSNYARATGRSIKNFYKENVVAPIKSLFSGSSEEDKYVDEKENEFQGYIDEAKKTTGTIYDSIAPAVSDFKCSDENTINDMGSPQLIALHGYVSESHTILTADGYILTVHRIPYSKNSSNAVSPRKTVLLHHGLLASSADWIMPGPGRGLAYILSDSGYDVWMANVRGNTYSRAHVYRPIDSYAFWNFTFHDVSQYDLPAVIDYIVAKKGDVEINYVGYSMGTTALFALLSTKTQYNDILKAGVALAPVAYLGNIVSPMKIISKFGNNIEYMMKLLGENEFLPRDAVIRYLAKHSCKVMNVEEALCDITMYTLCGHGKMQFDRSLMPLIFGHVPAGASTKTLAHYAQLINSGLFQQFDYGDEGNMKQYGNIKPPEYPIKDIRLPIALLSGNGDWLSTGTDVQNLFRQLANPIEHYIVPYEDFNHLDFVFGLDAPTLVYTKVMQLLEKSYDADIVTNYLNEGPSGYEEVNVYKIGI